MLNTLAGWLAVAARALATLLLVPFLIKRLGTEGYGLIALLGVLLVASRFLDLGLRQALGRQLMEQLGRKDRQAYSALMSTATVLFLCMGLVAASLCWIGAPLLVRAFRLSGPLVAPALWAIRVYGAGAIMLSFVQPLCVAVLSSHHRYDLTGLVATATGLLHAGLVFLAVSCLEDPVMGWVSASLASQLAGIFWLTLVVVRKYPWLRVSLSRVDMSQLRALGHLGGHMYVLQLTRMLAFQADPIVLTTFLGPAAAGIYRAGTRLTEASRPLITSISDQLLPLTTGSFVRRDTDDLQALLLRGTRLTFLFGLLVCSTILVVAPPLGQLWLGASLGPMTGVAVQVITLCALAELVEYASAAQWPVLLGMKRLRFLLAVQVPTSILNLGLSCYLVGFTEVGIPGVVLATLAVGLIRRPLLCWYTARLCGLSLGRYFRESYLRPLVVLVVTLVCGYALRLTCCTAATVTDVVLLIAGTGLGWLAATLWVGLLPDERAEGRRLLRTRMLHWGSPS